MIKVKSERKIAVGKRESTLKTLKQLDNNLWMMEYKSDYGLDVLLNQGVSSLLGLVRFLQKQVRLPKLAQNKNHNGFACSTFNARTVEGDYIFGRNFDYKEAPCVVVWTAPENSYRSVAVVDTTMFVHGTEHVTFKNSKTHLRAMAAPYASMDGINEKGLSIAVLELKSKSTKQNTGKKTITTTVAIRAVLDKCATVDEAIKLFSSFDMHDSLGLNYHYQIADANGCSAIIEYVDNKMCVIEQKKKDDNLILTNYFLTPGGDNHDGRGMDRYEHIEKRLKLTDGVISEDDAMELLSQVTLNYRHKLGHMVIALWSTVYNCNEKSMLLCAGMDYSKKYKFSVDKPGEVIKL